MATDLVCLCDPFKQIRHLSTSELLTQQAPVSALVLNVVYEPLFSAAQEVSTSTNWRPKKLGFPEEDRRQDRGDRGQEDMRGLGSTRGVYRDIYIYTVASPHLSAALPFH